MIDIMRASEAREKTTQALDKKFFSTLENINDRIRTNSSIGLFYATYRIETEEIANQVFDYLTERGYKVNFQQDLSSVTYPPSHVLNRTIIISWEGE